MTTTRWRRATVAGLLAAMAALPVAHADFELTDPQGRRILLKDNGTWRVVEPAAAASAASAPYEGPQSALRLEGATDAPGGCRFEFTLDNTLPYEIRSLVPQFTVLRANGVAYSTQTASFGPLRPGDSTRRAVQFLGIACRDVAKLLVQGGDRCEMGELNKFSDVKGACLARVRLLPSTLLTFEKGG